MAEGIDDNQSIGWFVQTSARDAGGKVQLQAVVQIGDDILGWFWVVFTSEQRGSQGLKKAFDSLEGLGGRRNSNVCALQLFGKKTECGVLLILLFGWKFFG